MIIFLILSGFFFFEKPETKKARGVFIDSDVSTLRLNSWQIGWSRVKNLEEGKLITVSLSLYDWLTTLSSATRLEYLTMLRQHLLRTKNPPPSLPASVNGLCHSSLLRTINQNFTCIKSPVTSQSLHYPPISSGVKIQARYGSETCIGLPPKKSCAVNFSRFYTKLKNTCRKKQNIGTVSVWQIIKNNAISSRMMSYTVGMPFLLEHHHPWRFFVSCYFLKA